MALQLFLFSSLRLMMHCKLEKTEHKLLPIAFTHFGTNATLLTLQLSEREIISKLKKTMSFKGQHDKYVLA